MSSSPVRALIALLVVMSLFVAACGSDSSDDEDADDTTTTQADETTTTELEEEAQPEEEVPTDQSASGLPTVEDIEAVDDFCTLWGMGESSIDFGEVAVTSADQLEQAAQVVNALLSRGVAIAPPEIEDDFTALAAALQDFYAILADYEFDLALLGQAAATDPELAARMEAIYTPELETQTANIEAWIAANC